MTSPIQLIYASTSGNTELVIETVAQELRQTGLECELHRAEKTSIEVVAQNQVFVFGTSTWEHGALNPFFRKLLDEMKKTNCQGKKAAFVGCGDRRYEPVLFCEGIEIVKKTWEAQGGTVLGDVLKIQGEAWRQLDSIVKPWAQEITPALSGKKSGGLFSSIQHAFNL